MDLSKALIASNIPNDYCGNILTHNAKIVEQINANQLHSAFQYRTQTTASQQQYLTDLFAPQVVHPLVDAKHRVSYHQSSHPIAAVLNEFCNYEASKFIERAREKNIVTFSIGDAVRPKVGAHHNCILINSLRDAYRVVSNTALLNNDALAHYAITGNNAGGCHQGSEKCDFKAKLGVAVHSLYDFEPEDIMETFERHECDQLLCFLFIPPSFYNHQLKGFDDEYFKIVHSGNNTYFSMGDHSIPYVHNTEKWKRWASLTKIDNGAFVVLRETVRHLGALHVFNLTRVHRWPGEFRMTVPLSKITRGSYLIPSIFSHANSGFVFEQHDLPHHVVPDRIVTAILKYAARTKDEGFNFAEFSTVMAGYSNKVTINENIWDYGWNPHPRVYLDVCIMLFIMGASQRKTRTQLVSKCFGIMKEDAKYGFFTGMVKDIWREIKKAVLADEPRLVGTTFVDTYKFWKFQPVAIEDMICSNIYRYDTSLYCKQREYEPQGSSESSVDSQVPLSPDASEESKSEISSCEDEGTSDTTISEETASLSSDSAASTESLLDTPSVHDSIKLHDAESLSEEDDEPTMDGIPLTNISLAGRTRGLYARLKNSIFDLINLGFELECFADEQNKHISNYCSEQRSFFREDLRKYCSIYANPPFTEQYITRFFQRINSIYRGVAVIILPDWEDIFDLVGDFSKIANVYRIPEDHLDPIFELNGVDFRTGRATNIIVWNSVPSTNLDIHELDQFQVYNRNSNPNHEIIRFPTQFRHGHCALQAFQTMYSANVSYISPSEIMRVAHKLLVDHLSGTFVSTVDFVPADYTASQVDDYIFRGIWQTNCSSHVLMLLAEHYRVNVHIYSSGRVIQEFGTGIDINIQYGNHHYSAMMTGGARDKFELLLNKVNDMHFSQDAWIELSAAPGHLTNLISRTTKQFVGAFYYKRGLKMLDDDQLADQNIYGYDNYKELQHLIEICKKKKNRVYTYICDVARAMNSEELTDEFNNIIKDHFNVGDNYIVKTFGNPTTTWELATKFEEVDTFKREDSSEVYYLLKNYKGEEIRKIEEVDALYRTAETHHSCKIAISDVNDFLGNFCFKSFDDVRERIQKKIPHLKGQHIHVSFSAITGYASAAKTSRAVATYPKAIFVSPTRTLAQKLTKMGVAAYTQHAVFSNINDKTEHIVVDEISQFPVEYIALLKIMAKKAKITVCGDVHQVPYVNFHNKAKFTTFREIGVVNNIREVYSIPQDIAKLINNRHGFNIISKSAVENGLFFCADKLEKFIASGIPVIAFNEDTVAHLKDSGHNAHTITTYQGSRDDTVVFFVDGAAVESNITAKSEWMYTAMTRGVNQLVVIGNDADVVAKYYLVDGRNMRSFEEITQNRLHHDRKEKKDEVVLPYATEQVKVERTTLPPEEIANIILQEYQPTNDPYSASTFRSDIPKPEHGSITTTYDVLHARPRDVVGYKVSAAIPNLVKNQVSGDPLTTLECNIMRYTSSKPKLSKNDQDITLTMLCNGLSLAVTGSIGNFHDITRHLEKNKEGVMGHYAEYLESLDKKAQGRSDIYDDLDTMFEFETETLEFFSKQQSKFKAANDFDSKIKAAQGVMSMSKKINVLFSAYARYILTQMQELIAKNKRRIILATHDNDTGFAVKYGMMYDKCNVKGKKWSNNDFSEWDASYRTPFVSMMSQLMLASGCPPELVQQFAAYRRKWKAISQTRDGKIICRGYEKQFSGNPFTICENTLGNMALCYAVFRYSNMEMALFKGDDSSVLCASCRISEKGAKLIKKLGHGLKLHQSDVGEFAGWFLINNTIFPDVVRQAAKFIGKMYRDQKHFDEALMSLQERVSVVNENNRIRGAIAHSYFYKEITTEQILIICDFLLNSRSIKFENLSKVFLPVATDQHHKNTTTTK